jgi:hypothetical protein
MLPRAAIDWYGPDQGAGLIASIIGALIPLECCTPSLAGVRVLFGLVRGIVRQIARPVTRHQL